MHAFLQLKFTRHPQRKDLNIVKPAKMVQETEIPMRFDPMDSVKQSQNHEDGGSHNKPHKMTL